MTLMMQLPRLSNLYHTENTAPSPLPTSRRRDLREKRMKVVSLLLDKLPFLDVQLGEKWQGPMRGLSNESHAV